jgi:hypothetical protein
MPAPSANWNLVPVTGQYVNIDDTPVVGRIVFTPTATRAVDQADLVTIIGIGIAVELDSNGAFTTALPATDDPDITPTEFSYSVNEDFPGGAQYEITLSLATLPGGINMATVAPVEPNPGTGLAVVTRSEFDALDALVQNKVVTVPTGTTGFASEPNGTLWVEYTP